MSNLTTAFFDQASTIIDADTADTVRLLADEPPPPEIIEGKAWNALHPSQQITAVENSDEIVTRLRERLENSPTAKQFLERLDEKNGKIVIADLGDPKESSSVLFGLFDPDTGQLAINVHLPENMMMLTAAHELTHAVPQTIDSSYLHRNVEETNDYTPASAAGWLFGAEAAAETTSILIAYELREAGDKGPYNMALNHNSHMEDLLGLETGWFGTDLFKKHENVEMRDEAMAKAFDAHLDQGIGVAAAKAFDTWLTHNTGIGSYIHQASRLYDESLKHVGYDKDLQTYIIEEDHSDDVGVRSLSEEELTVITTIGPYNIRPHITIDPSNDQNIMNAIKRYDQHYWPGKLLEKAQNVQAYNDAGTPPNGRTAYRREDIEEYKASGLEEDITLFEYLGAKEQGHLDHIKGYVQFLKENPSASEQIFLEQYVDLTQKGILPLPEMPENVEDFASTYGGGLSDVSIKIGYSAALQTQNQNIITATERIYDEISKAYKPDDYGFHHILDEVQAINENSEHVGSWTFTGLLEEEAYTGHPTFGDAASHFVDAQLAHRGLFSQDAKIPDSMQEPLNTLNHTLSDVAYKTLLTRGTEEDIEAISEAIRKLAEHKADGTLSDYIIDDGTESIVRGILQKYNPETDWSIYHDINYMKDNAPAFAELIAPVEALLFPEPAEEQPEPSGPTTKGL